MNSTQAGILNRFIQNPSVGHKVLVVVLDGVGSTSLDASLTAALQSRAGVLPETPFLQGNAVCAAYVPHLQSLTRLPLYRTLLAHGPSVGLPSKDDMGNSEVGHNALGAGRVFAQGAKLVNAALETGALFLGEGWNSTVRRAELIAGTSTLHFCGLMSDGNVHSHMNHLFGMLTQARKEGVKRVRLHMLIDGRDVPPTSALTYIDALEQFLSGVRSPTFDVRVASGGGRTQVTMDRYESDWRIVERGYDAHVLGQGRTFPSLRTAVETFRAEGSRSDQDLPPFVIADGGKPVGTVEDGDSFVFFNFRGDRAIEITRALTEESFHAFERKRFPKVHYAGMMQYDGDLKLPKVYLVEPPTIAGTVGERLARTGVPQFACSETQKFGHVTYFWNGNRSGKFNEQTEHYVEIPSDRVPFEERPWMKAAEIADATIMAMEQDTFRVGRINFANGDMVGHTGDFAATVVAMGAVDVSLGRVLAAAKKTGTIVLVTADHGNADEMYELDKKTGRTSMDASGNPKLKTSHTLSPVPCAIFNAELLGVPVTLRDDLPHAGLANVASTVLELAGFEPPPEFEPSILKWNTPPDQGSRQKQSQPAKASERPDLVSVAGGAETFAVAREAVAFYRTVKRLRSPEGGCPWDKEQTVASLRSYLIEEAYEATAAAGALAQALAARNAVPGQVEGGTDPAVASAADAFADELGDVLLQVYLNAQVTRDEGLFGVTSVYEAITEKMVRRHPHVFVPAENEALVSAEPGAKESAGAVVSQWDRIKLAEAKGASSKSPDGVAPAGKSLLAKALKKSALPTLEYLREVSKRSYRLGFAWGSLEGTFGDLRSEVDELAAELMGAVTPLDRDRVLDEVGDVAYALANVVTYLNENVFLGDERLDLDLAARASCAKFVTRFAEMEEILRERGTPLTEEIAKATDLDSWNALWNEAKKRRYR